MDEILEGSTKKNTRGYIISPLVLKSCTLDSVVWKIGDLNLKLKLIG